jgi:Uma2 family endonuclease
MAEPAVKARRTVAEWRAWEESQPERYELLGDEPRMMAGGTAAHNELAQNIAGWLRERLRGRDCRTFLADVKVVLPSGRWLYPDVFVRCGPRTGRETAFGDPVLVVEVLSASTAGIDLGAKRWAYQELASLADLLFVASDRVKVEHAVPVGDGSWRSVFYTDLEQVVPLDGLGLALPLAAIYEGVPLEGEADGDALAAI